MIASSSLSQAVTQTYMVTWSGASFSNAAEAVATFNLELDDVPNPGFFFGMPSWISDISLTVSNADSGNGTFTQSDFDDISWSTNRGTLNMMTELVGQPTIENSWGSDLNGGDFNLFGSGSAPSGIVNFQLTTNAGTGDDMLLTSFAPVPEPSTYAFLVGLLAVGHVALRRRKA